MEGELMRLLQLTKEAGHSATLTFEVKGGETLNFSLKLQRWRPIRKEKWRSTTYSSMPGLLFCQ